MSENLYITIEEQEVITVNLTQAEIITVGIYPVAVPHPASFQAVLDAQNAAADAADSEADVLAALSAAEAAAASAIAAAAEATDIAANLSAEFADMEAAIDTIEVTVAETEALVAELDSDVSDMQTEIDGKEDAFAAGTTDDYFRGDKTFQPLNKSAVGLSNVDNTSDANKPVSTATQTALNLKEGTVTAGTTSQYYRGDKTWQTLDKTAVGLSNVPNTDATSRANHTGTQTASTISDFATTVASTALLKSNNLSDLSSATTARTNLGLGNVDNTSDANKPVSTAQQTAIDAKVINNTSGSETDKAASVDAMKTYVAGVSSGAVTILSKTANYTMLATDGIIKVDGSGGSFNITFPTSPTSGKLYVVKRTDSTPANAVSLVGTIDGFSSWKLHTIGESYGFVWDSATSTYTMVFHNTSTDWIAFPSVVAGTLITATTTNPTYGTVATNAAYWRRVGKNAEIRWDYRHTAASGTPGSGSYLFNVPSFLTMDSSLVTVNTGLTTGSGYDSTSLGTIRLSNNATHSLGHLSAYSTTQLKGHFWNSATAGVWGTSTFDFAYNAIMIVSINATLPINGWKP